jgi:hypothetical protein
MKFVRWYYRKTTRAFRMLCLAGVGMAVGYWSARLVEEAPSDPPPVFSILIMLASAVLGFWAAFVMPRNR